MNELLTLSGTELARRIAAKEVSPLEVLEAHISRIEQVNPDLNAMVEDDFVRARKTAREQTERLAHSVSDLPPLFGVPFTVKEMLAYAGMKRTGGSIHHRHDVMDWDATILARMKHAGAIPMGTTNVPELGFWFETYNPIYGRTNNPYDDSRTCGGSSGGEGALIGAGASPFGLGSDIGGSIRIPAFFCGVFGHKPSRYWLPLTGHFPYGPGDFANTLLNEKYPFTSVGPLSRRAADLSLLTKIMAGADEHDRSTLKNIRHGEKPLQWEGRRVLICPNPSFHGARGTDGELSQVVVNCGKLFEELGAHVEELDSRFFVKGTKMWFAALKNSKTKDLHEALMGPEKNLSIGKELFKLAMGRPDYTLPNLIVSLSEILGIGSKDLTEELTGLEQMKKDLDEKLGPDGILILPPHSRVAPKHRAVLWSPFDFIYTGLFTTLGNPATSVPTGLNPEGLPLGVQVVARHGMDHLTLATAEFLESTFGGWVPPRK
ncbi:amidase [Bdellovibrio sp. HCB2-146]|uniref:amidase n=1 Tax=Bdellovibrio sp. HCB2-146 TaxID=3394362 RepID=UPI0039BC4F31